MIVLKTKNCIFYIHIELQAILHQIHDIRYVNGLLKILNTYDCYTNNLNTYNRKKMILHFFKKGLKLKSNLLKFSFHIQPDNIFVETSQYNDCIQWLINYWILILKYCVGIICAVEICNGWKSKTIVITIHIIYIDIFCLICLKFNKCHDFMN